MSFLVAASSTIAAEASGAKLGLLTNAEEMLAMKPFMRPKWVSLNFNLPIIIAASLVFLIILMWFEAMRLSIEYAFLNTVETRRFVLSYLVFSIVITILFGGAMILIIKYWIK